MQNQDTDWLYNNSEVEYEEDTYLDPENYPKSEPSNDGGKILKNQILIKN